MLCPPCWQSLQLDAFGLVDALLKSCRTVQGRPRGPQSSRGRPQTAGPFAYTDPHLTETPSAAAQVAGLESARPCPCEEQLQQCGHTLCTWCSRVCTSLIFEESDRTTSYLELTRQEVQLPPPLSSAAPCSSPVHLCKDRMATSPVHDTDCSTMLYSQLGSEPHSATYSTNMGKTLTLYWENIRKTTDSRCKWPDSTVEKYVQESFHYEFQYNCLLVWSSVEVLIISLLPPLQLTETYVVEVTVLNS